MYLYRSRNGYVVLIRIYSFIIYENVTQHYRDIYFIDLVIFNLCICCQFEDSQIISPKIIPKKDEPLQHLTVTNEG